MKVSEALLLRKSTRAFVNKAVELEKIQRILNLAKHAPSGVNTQPWHVAVVTGEAKQALQRKLENEYRAGNQARMDYHYYPQDWREPYKSRRKACGLQLYSALGINREDKARQLEQWASNYRAFDAPAVIFLFMDHGLQAGSFLDCGMFLQSLMLAAQELGLSTCPQASLAEYPDIVKAELGYPEDSILVCGMALGYEDAGAAVNAYRTTRLELSEFARFYS